MHVGGCRKISFCRAANGVGDTVTNHEDEKPLMRGIRCVHMLIDELAREKKMRGFCW